MSTKTVSVTEFKQNLGSMINKASYGRERIILLSHGKERAALVSIEDLRLLETILDEKTVEAYKNRQLSLLNEARLLRENMETQGYEVDSTSTRDDIREERLDDLTSLR